MFPKLSQSTERAMVAPAFNGSPGNCFLNEVLTFALRASTFRAGRAHRCLSGNGERGLA